MPQLLGRALRLRCPVCGQGKLFHALFAMHSHCTACGVKLEREPGFFLGAIYFNYGLTALLVMILFIWLRFGSPLSRQQALLTTVGLAILFPILFFRHARSLWLAFDQLYDPRDLEG